MAFVTYPLNNIEYRAEDAGLYNSTRNTGVYASNDFDCTVTGSDNIAHIGVGLLWAKLNRFYGVVSAVKENTTVDLGLPDPAYPRWDRLCARWEKIKNGFDFFVLKGTAQRNPQKPEITRNADVYDIVLYDIKRPAGAVSVTADQIYDMRLDPKVCGLMADAITSVDTGAINRQVTAFIAQLEAELNDVRDKSAFMVKAEYAGSAPGIVKKADESYKLGGHTAEYFAGAGSVRVFSATFKRNGWTQNPPGTWTQTVPCDGVKESYNTSPPWFYKTGVEEYDNAMDDALSLFRLGRIVTLDGKLKATLKSAPPDIDVEIFVQRRTQDNAGGQDIQDDIISPTAGWSSKKIVQYGADTYCSPFHQKATMVQGELVGDYPMSVKTYIDPVQKGSGEPRQENVREITGWTGAKLMRCGKNLLDYKNNNKTGSSITLIPNGVKYVPTSSADRVVSYNFNSPIKKGSHVTISAKVEPNKEEARRLLLFLARGKTKGEYGAQVFSGKTTITTEDDTTGISLYVNGEHVNKGYAYSITNIQVEVGTAETPYEPYQGNNYTVQFKRTVYGGTFEWNTGILTSTLDSEGHELPEPEVYQLTPQEILSLQGTNTLYSDTGETEVFARKDPIAEKQSLEKRITALESKLTQI